MSFYATAHLVKEISSQHPLPNDITNAVNEDKLLLCYYNGQK